ncbi:MAG: MaoC family dehydratase [Rhodospirillales bacterium]
MRAQVSLAELRAKVGQELGLSDWIVVDQARIDAFAEVGLDDQFIHVDPERARAETPFGGTIAHGFLTLSLLTPLGATILPELTGRAMGINYGIEKLRFLAPVRAGKRLRGRFHLLDVTERQPGQILIRYGVSVEIEGEEKPALAAEWLALSIMQEKTS